MLTGDGRMAEKKKEYLIGDVSRIVGMSRDALRFYEKKGVIRSQKKENGYRYFSEDGFSKIYKKYIDHINSSGNWYADFLPDGSLFDYKNSMEGRKVFVSDYFDDDDDSVDGNADSYVCNLVKAWNAEYVYSAGIAQFFWKYVLYLSVQTIYEVTADQCDRSCAY